MVAATNPIQTLICLALSVFGLLLLIRVVVSWLQLFGLREPVTGPLRSAYDLLFDVTEPVLRPLRRIVPPAGRFDLSIVVAFVVIFVAQNVIC
ncbi:MAG TPA: YggT family protein [Actinomycetota bacterium]|jgi:YggT family protein